MRAVEAFGTKRESVRDLGALLGSMHSEKNVSEHMLFALLSKYAQAVPS